MIIFHTGALAIIIPQLDNFISLVGAISSAAIALIFPPILHILCFWDHGISKFEITKNILITILGGIGSIAGTIISILAIIEGFEKGTDDVKIEEIAERRGEIVTVLFANRTDFTWW